MWFSKHKAAAQIQFNVKQVKYQESEVDYFTHRYWYDADNRITEAWTSRNNVIWDRDAKYFYYPHGPLARVELGSDVVQGLDYYYSIHGWIKGVNVPGDSLALSDPGLDAERSLSGSNGPNALNGRDAYAFGLGFYAGDYYTIGGKDLAGAKQAIWTQIGDSVLGNGLYNGNIPWMNTDLRDPEQVLEAGLRGQSLMTYQYDQLNRLKRASGALDWTSGSGWSFGSLGYRAYFDYDRNGNILGLDRHAPRFIPNDPNMPNGPGTWQTVHFDGMEYAYNRDANGKLLNNKLRHVEDPLERATGSGVAPSAYFGNDFSDQGDLSLVQVSENYEYDAIGNLVRDSIEEIDSIYWDLYGKIAAVERSTNGWNAGMANLEFKYDGMGNRLSKRVETASGEESWYYLRDAQGNPLAIYEREQDGDTLYTYLRELPIYGSDRVGLTKANTLISKKCVANCDVTAGGDELPLRSLIFGEVFYDSPKTEDTASVETHLGEYIVAINTTDDSLDLSDLRLYEDESGDSLALSGALAPGQRLLIAWGESDQGSDLQQIAGLPAELLEGPVTWQTSVGLADEVGRLRLRQISAGVNVDGISYGGFYGLNAGNAYIADSLLDSLGQRSSLKSVQRVSYLRQGRADQVLGEKSVVVDLIDPYLDPQPYEGLADGVFNRLKGARCYELKNHLGNVLVTVADWKVGREFAASDSVDWYEGAVLTQTDYYPFGWGLPGRQASSPEYRYGYNGQEKDDELLGEGNSLSFRFRISDARLGRFLSVDPLAPEYPWYTPYQFAGNKVIAFIELEGLEELYFAQHTNTTSYQALLYVLSDAGIYSELESKIKIGNIGVDFYFSTVYYNNIRYDLGYEIIGKTGSTHGIDKSFPSEDHINRQHILETFYVDVIPSIDAKKKYVVCAIEKEVLDKIETIYKSYMRSGKENDLADLSYLIQQISLTWDHELRSHGIKWVDGKSDTDGHGDHKIYFGNNLEDLSKGDSPYYHEIEKRNPQSPASISKKKIIISTEKLQEQIKQFRQNLLNQDYEKNSDLPFIKFQKEGNFK